MKIQLNQVEFIKGKYCTVDKIINALFESSENVFFFVIFSTICMSTQTSFFLKKSLPHYCVASS